jgi:hypothetical protein
MRIRTLVDKERKKIRRAISREKKRRWMLDLLVEQGCFDCETRDVRVLTFDHLRDKTAVVSQLVQKDASWDRIKQEIAKTVVRCLNCHSIKTEERANSRRHQYWQCQQNQDP